MSYWQHLWRVQLIGLAALTAFGVTLALFFIVEGLLISPNEIEVGETLFMVVVLTIIYGALPVLLIGAPAYVALISSDRFHWLPMLVISILPGAAMLFIRLNMGVIGMIAGTFVFVLTHLAYRRRIANE